MGNYNKTVSIFTSLSYWASAISAPLKRGALKARLNTNTRKLGGSGKLAVVWEYDTEMTGYKTFSKNVSAFQNSFDRV